MRLTSLNEFLGLCPHHLSPWSYALDWLQKASRELYAFCEFLADIPTDDGMRRTIDVAIHTPSAARAIVDIWSRSIRPWEALSKVPAMLEAAGSSPEEVLAKYEAGATVGRMSDAQEFVNT